MLQTLHIHPPLQTYLRKMHMQDKAPYLQPVHFCQSAPVDVYTDWARQLSKTYAGRSNATQVTNHSDATRQVIHVLTV